MAKPFSLVFRVERGVFHQFVQAVLQRIFDNAVHMMALVTLIDADALEIPQLVSECGVRFGAVVDAAKLNHFAAIGAKSSAHQTPDAIQLYLTDCPFGEASCPYFGAHR
jgi:hypothetical protein